MFGRLENACWVAITFGRSCQTKIPPPHHNIERTQRSSPSLDTKRNLVELNYAAAQWKRQSVPFQWKIFFRPTPDFFLARARCLSAGLRYLRLTRLPRHDRGPVPGGNRSAASCLCTVLRRALYHYATRSPFFRPTPDGPRQVV